MIEKTDILLINPPFGPLNGPYISIPVLAAYLKKKSLKIEALDASLVLYKKIIFSDIIENKKKYINKRFLELNNKATLSFKETNEFVLLHAMIIDCNRYRFILKKLENEELT